MTDYLDVLIEPETVPAGLPLFFDHLRRHGARWDLCDFQQLPEDSTLLRPIPSHGTGPPGPLSFDTVQEICPVLRLPEPDGALPAALPAALPRRLRGNLAYYARRLEKAGGAEYRRATAADVDSMLEALFRLHGSRWRSRGLPGVLFGSRVRRFHRQVASGFLERGWLRLYGMVYRGTLVAALHCFACRGRGYYYAGGFEPRLGRFSPGSLLIHHAVEALVREGAREFHFLRGGEAYKYRWGARDRVNRRLWIAQPTVSGRLARLLSLGEGEAERAVKRFLLHRSARSRG